jgi:hypothetical protein
MRFLFYLNTLLCKLDQQTGILSQHPETFKFLKALAFIFQKSGFHFHHDVFLLIKFVKNLAGRT